MKPFPHHYHVHLGAAPTGYAELATEGVPLLKSAPPAAYDGPGDAWSPEHLLLAAVGSCFLFTVRAIARGSNVEFTKLDLDAVGTVTRGDRVTRFAEVVLRPRVTIAAGTDRERRLQLLEKAERICLVSASLATPVRLEPEVQGLDQLLQRTEDLTSHVPAFDEPEAALRG